MQYSKYDVEEYNSSNKNITNKEPGDWKSPFPPFICVYEKFDQLSSVNKLRIYCVSDEMKKVVSVDEHRQCDGDQR